MATAQKKKISEVELTELSSNVLKLSAENKINQKNSWLLPLIDYIDEVLHKQCSGEKTNFQAASVTLDASVKIYSNRVDSVHGSVYQVLGGLNRTERSPSDDQDDENGNGEENADGTQPTKTRKRAHVSTIESHPESLISRKVESEFEVDPLFRKMSAKFDEGGARGMLMNQLFVGSNCRLVFDSSDLATGESAAVDHEASAAFAENPRAEAEAASAAAAAATAVAITADAADNVPSPVSDIEVPSDIEPAAFVKNPSVVSSPSAASAVSHHTAVEAAAPVTIPTVEDDVTAEAGMSETAAAPADDYAMPLMDVDDFDGTDESDNDGAGYDDAPLPPMPRTPGTPGAQAVAAVAGDALGSLQFAFDGDNEYGWFRPEKLQGWAGPNHWKFRRCQAKGEEVEETEKAAAKAKGTRKPKTVFKIDFRAEIDQTVLFKRSTRKSKSLPASSAASEEPLTLPRDLHFHVSSLHKLFNRPHFTLRRVEGSNTVVMVSDAPQKKAGFGAGGFSPINEFAGGADFGDAEDDDDEGGAEYYDDVPMADFGETQEPAAEVLAGVAASSGATEIVPTEGAAVTTEVAAEEASAPLQLIAQPKKVEKIDIGYAKVMKKVDVHALKTGLWKEMQGITQGGKKKTTFTALCERAPAAMPKEELADVSTAYCFICLLHLANEHSLKLTSNPQMTDVLIEQSAS